ncbi:MAG TPA: regulatory protein RecX [Mizugakiibacter sp.]|nr:regulatory protein RecX [Mizugakiibacter sp.]
MLARREYSRHEITVRLTRSGYSETEVEAALERLLEQGYQNDQRFGEMLVRTRIAQGYGPLRIRAELKAHQLLMTEIQGLLDTMAADWPELACKMLRRRYGQSTAVDRQQRLRRAQFLLRRGFDAATVRSVTRVEVDVSITDDECKHRGYF